MSSPLLRGIGANLFAQTVTALTQLCSVPVLLHAWGTETLGLWLTLSAWTALLSLTDGGVMAAGGNAMTMLAARGEREAAASLFSQVLRFVLAASFACGSLVAITAILFPHTHGSLAQFPLRGAILALGAAALASLPFGTIELGFRAGGEYATGVAATSSVRLIETVGVLVVARSGGGILGAAATLLALRLLGGFGLAVLLRRRAPWLAAAPRPADWTALRALVRPAIAVLAIPIGFALSLQGMTIAAGLVLPAGGVAIFVAARTLTRAIVQGIGLLTNAVMPEMSAAAGRGDVRRTASLLRINLGAGLGLLLPGWAALVIFGPGLMARWTGGLLRPDPAFFGLMATAALLHGCWLSAANLLLAVNRQGEYAYAFVGAAAVATLLAAGLGRMAGLDGVAAASVAGEAVMAALVLPGQVRSAFRPAEPVGSQP